MLMDSSFTAALLSTALGMASSQVETLFIYLFQFFLCCGEPCGRECTCMVILLYLRDSGVYGVS